MAWIASGVSVNAAADAVTLGCAPALAGLAATRWNSDSANAGLLAVWIGAAVVLTAASGGALAPVAASFLIAPALARALNFRWMLLACVAAVAGYLIAAGAAVLWPPSRSLGLFPQAMTAISLVFAGVLIAIERVQTPRVEMRASEAAQRIAEVSHELRTPLTHILGFAEILEREMFGPIGERNVEYAGLIRKSGMHLLELVNDLLDLSKMEAGRYELELESFDARAIVDEVVRMSADAAEKKQIKLEAQAPGTPIEVNADHRAMRRMLINTVGNAVKFTPEGGRIVVAARANGTKLILDTIDNGPGIPAAERARLGNPYEQGESGRAQGTGLGLALVRALAELHGGGLSFHDAPGGGALVRIEMPVLRS